MNTRNGHTVSEVSEHKDMLRGKVFMEKGFRIIHWHTNGMLTLKAKSPFDLVLR